MCLTDLVYLTCVIKDTLSRCRLAGIDMSHDSDITDLVQWEHSRHKSLLSLNLHEGKITSDSERTPCSLQPSYVYRPSS